ncbi:MAG: 50S ribosomal protein L34 [Candidatus Levybacteria bacterium]|nr:50S ribosomal protein L34 [Candidatus Levybacteria bacterium]
MKHKKVKGIKKHGWMSRNATHNGRKLLKRRMLKGRRKLTISL